MKHSKTLDEDKLRFACSLIKAVCGERALVIAEKVLNILQFGGISTQDMLVWLENTGGES